MSAVKKEEVEELLFMSDFGPISNAKLHEVRAQMKRFMRRALFSRPLLSLSLARVLRLDLTHDSLLS